MTNLQATLDTFSAPAFAADFNAATRDRWGNSGHRRDRRERLLAFQQGLCIKCGQACSTDEAELAHLVPATFHGARNAVHAGFLYGNITVWHGACNHAHGERLTRVSDLARPDLVFTGTTRELPTLPR